MAVKGVEKICNNVFQGCREVKIKDVIDFNLTRAAPNGGYCYPVITGHIQTLNKLPVLVYMYVKCSCALQDGTLQT